MCTPRIDPARECRDQLLGPVVAFKRAEEEDFVSKQIQKLNDSETVYACVCRLKHCGVWSELERSKLELELLVPFGVDGTSDTV